MQNVNVCATKPVEAWAHHGPIHATYTGVSGNAACMSGKLIVHSLRAEWIDWQREGQECSKVVNFYDLSFSKWWYNHHTHKIEWTILEPIDGRPRGQTHRAGAGQVCPTHRPEGQVWSNGKCGGSIPKHGPVQEEEGVWHGRPIHWVESCATLTQPSERDIYESACSDWDD